MGSVNNLSMDLAISYTINQISIKLNFLIEVNIKITIFSKSEISSVLFVAFLCAYSDMVDQ